MIAIDPKSIRGVTVEYSSIPWTSVVAFGVKTSGRVTDRDSEVLVYTNLMFDPPTVRDSDAPPQPGMSFWELDFNEKLVNVLAIHKYLVARCCSCSSTTAANHSDVSVPLTVYAVSGTPERELEKSIEALGGGDDTAANPAECNTMFHTTVPLLLEDERTILAFKAGRDVTLFTSRRILMVDTEGWSGDKIVYRSVPYDNIRAFAAKSGGSWDRDAEVFIFTRNQWSMNKLNIDFTKGRADIITIQRLLAAVVLGSHEQAEQYLENPAASAPKAAQSVDLNSVISFFTNSSSEEDATAVDAELHNKAPILLDHEHVVRAFRTGRDLYVYTNLRLLLVDVRGIQGKKVEYQSFPWQWCHGFEIQTAGHLDPDAELYLYNDAPARRRIKHSILVKRFDIHEMQAFICETLLFPNAENA
jgi:Bacterial PH domain